MSGQGGFVWYELMTTDPGAADLFYSHVVKGWSFGEQVPTDVDYRMIQRGDGGNAGGVFGLTEEMTKSGARPTWMGYVGVADVDRMAARVEEKGGTILMPPWDVPGAGRMAMVSDPQGAPFYLMRPEPPEGEEDYVSDAFSMEEAQHVRWNELATSDPDAALAFYSELFGWTQEGETDLGEAGRYLHIRHGDEMIGAVMARPPQMPASAWTYYIGVEDIDRAQGAVTAGGGQIVHGPMEIPGGEFALNGIDPQGAFFALVGPKPGAPA